jgi:hypothetical protein
MPLDLDHVSIQVNRMATSIRGRRQERELRIANARQQLAITDSVAINRRSKEGKVTFLVGELPKSPATTFSPLAAPNDYCVTAVDGSSIDVDRHSPARCYLINIGRVLIRYGADSHAMLSNEPRLYASDADLIMVDPVSSGREQWVEGPLLAIRRAVEEVQALAALSTQAIAQGVPTLALLDGSLIYWGLGGQSYPDFVRQAFLDEMLLPALESLQRLAEDHDIAVASYISLPRSTDAVNALRIGLCPFRPPNCDHHCGTKRPGTRECDGVSGITDIELFSDSLRPGERTGLLGSTSSVVERYYGAHRINFYYVNVGSEIGRVEVPQWVASNPRLLDLTHSLIVDQCRRGHGYPIAIAEAHEQAVLRGQDRAAFQRLVEANLALNELTTVTSEKSRSKRARWL